LFPIYSVIHFASIRNTAKVSLLSVHTVLRYDFKHTTSVTIYSDEYNASLHHAVSIILLILALLQKLHDLCARNCNVALRKLTMLTL